MVSFVAGWQRGSTGGHSFREKQAQRWASRKTHCSPGPDFQAIAPSASRPDICHISILPGMEIGVALAWIVKLSDRQDVVRLFADLKTRFSFELEINFQCPPGFLTSKVIVQFSPPSSFARHCFLVPTSGVAYCGRDPWLIWNGIDSLKLWPSWLPLPTSPSIKHPLTPKGCLLLQSAF